MSRFVITDVGSTTTKAILIAEKNGEHRLVGRGEAPTTVEAPYEDVVVGVLEAISRLGRAIGKDLVHPENIVRQGIEYYSSSSAGGGLQVLVIGLYSKMTASSAQRAALGAGAILLEVINADDGRPLGEKIEIVRRAKPDMILIAGGIDGGNTDYVLEFADIVRTAKPEPRFGSKMKLPIIYAGNSEAAPLVEDTLAGEFDLHIVDNLRPSFNSENLGPARGKIHELFLSHVMQQAPGYDRLAEKVAAPVMPTPLAVGTIMKSLADQETINILGLDIGGATTDVFSVIDGEFHRTVSANLGMSYSIANVLETVGIENIKRWLPFRISDEELENQIASKMQYPTTLPTTVRELLIEQAVAREAISTAITHHQDLVKTLPREQTLLEKALKTQAANLHNLGDVETRLKMSKIGLIVGSGGVLSHAPRREQAAMMLLDACRPLGVTRLAVDSIFMMPHLGVLAQKYPEIALQVLKRDCFVPLGTEISGEGTLKPGQPALRVQGRLDGEHIDVVINSGEIKVLPLGKDKKAVVNLQPNPGIDIGAGPGGSICTEVVGGALGIIVDMRLLSHPCEIQAHQLKQWLIEAGAFTAEELAAVEGEG